MSNLGPFWVDNLYLKVARTNVLSDFTLLSAESVADKTAGMYVTNVTMHGDSWGKAAGAVMRTASLYLKGVLHTCPRKYDLQVQGS